jgi:hypothetical protein
MLSSGVDKLHQRSQFLVGKHLQLLKKFWTEYTNNTASHRTSRAE